MSNPLAPDSLNALVKDLLPDNASLPNPATAIAMLAHGMHTSLGFRLVKPKPVDSEGGSSDDPRVRNQLQSGWFDRNADEESFAVSYRHDQSSLLFEIRINRLGSRTVVNAVAVEDNKTATLDIVTFDYLSNSSFPRTVSSDFTFQSLFNSPNRLTDFISLYKTQIIQKLLPGLVKPGYNEDPSSSSSGSAPPPAAGPSQPRPQVPEPDYPDRGGLGGRLQPLNPGQNPLEIGRSDLDPLGGQIGRMPGAGGDGMFVGPNHPLFNRERDQNDPLRLPGTGGNGGQRGPWGGDGFLPPLGAPPGARFDPVGPFAPGGGLTMPRRNWGDEMPPPGFDDEGGQGFLPGNLGGMGGFGGGFNPPRGGGGGFGGGGAFGNMYM